MHVSKETNGRLSARCVFFSAPTAATTTFADEIRWAEAFIALVEHRMTEEEFVREFRPFVVET
jgi:hypothetical protein